MPCPTGIELAKLLTQERPGIRVLLVSGQPGRGECIMNHASKGIEIEEVEARVVVELVPCLTAVGSISQGLVSLR